VTSSWVKGHWIKVDAVAFSVGLFYTSTTATGRVPAQLRDNSALPGASEQVFVKHHRSIEPAHEHHNIGALDSASLGVLGAIFAA